jgi:hypothetical protein
VKQKNQLMNVTLLNKICSEKYNKFIYYWWVAQHIATPQLATKWTKRMGPQRFSWAQMNCDFRFTLIVYIIHKNGNLIWEDFGNF